MQFMKAKNSLKKFLMTLGFLLFFIGFYSDFRAEEKTEFDVSEMIMHHIKDAHEWHLFGPEHGGTSIYLPVILVDNGIKTFSSSLFYHGKEVTSKQDSSETVISYFIDIRYKILQKVERKILKKSV